MAKDRPIRALGSLAAGGGGVALALWAGAPLVAALFALIGGIAAFSLAPRWEEEGSAAAPPPAANGGPALPNAAELLAGVEEPRLIVRGRRVLIANPAAKAMLGEHIEGVDVRLAIRHPAAAERLSDRAGEAEESFTRTELVGLGEPGRHWEMTTALLADGSRLVRLTDRSAAVAAERMRTDFVANASHELRTPLATLLGYLEILQDEESAPDPDTSRRFVRVMLEEASRMRELVDDLISLSRIEAERFAVPRDPVDLLPLIEEARQGLEPLAAERESGIAVENEAGPTIVAGDRAQLSQLLRNLLSNALKYGREGAQVRVRLDDAGPELLRLSVIDQGEGIAPEHLPRLTERFYRVDPGRSRAAGGTGLGLAIVKHIVIRHRGRLDIRSTPGEGTSARVYLPRAQAGLS